MLAFDTAVSAGLGQVAPKPLPLTARTAAFDRPWATQDGLRFEKRLATIAAGALRFNDDVAGRAAAFAAEALGGVPYIAVHIRRGVDRQLPATAGHCQARSRAHPLRCPRH